MYSASQERRESRPESDAELEVRVVDERPFGALDTPAEQDPAEPEPAEEDREHGSRRRRRSAEGELKKSLPRGLVDERGKAGPEQQQGDRADGRNHPLPHTNVRR